MTHLAHRMRSIKIFQVRTSAGTGLNNTGRRLTCAAAARHSLFECDDYVLRLFDVDESAMVSWMLGSSALMRYSQTWIIRSAAVFRIVLTIYTLFTHRLVDSDWQIKYHQDATYDPL